MGLRGSQGPATGGAGMLVLTLVCLLLAACGPSTPAPSTSSQDSAPAGQAVSIWADPIWVGAISEMAAAYQQATGTTVTVTPVPAGSMRSQVRAKAPQGQGPDLFVAANPWLGELAADGLVSELPLGDQAAGFTRLSLDAFRLAGRAYGAPFSGQNIALLRNSKLAPKQPKSIDAMATTGAKLKAAGKVALPIGLPIGPQGDARSWYPMYSAAGGYLYAQLPDGSYDPQDLGLGLPGSIQAGRRLAELVTSAAVDPKVGRAAASKAFAAGRTPYLIGGAADVAAARAAGVEVAIGPVPGYADTPEAAATVLVEFQGFLLSAFARNRDAAVELVQRGITSTAFMDAMQRAGGGQPAWRESLSRAMADPTVAAFAKVGQEGAPMPNLAGVDFSWSQLDRAQLEVVSGTSPAVAMRTARKAVLAASASAG